MRLLLEKIRKILRDRRARQMLTRIVSSLAAVVVFITTYALVLPAITMESQAACGIPAHQHDDSCYEEVLVCGLEESEEHQHDDSCYEKELVCGMEAHTHSAACYSQASGEGDVGVAGEVGSSAEDYAVVAATTEVANGSASGTGDTDAKASGTDINVDDSTDTIDDAADAAVDADAGLSALSASEDAYVPELEPLFFDQLLTKKTGIYYFHSEEGETIPENSADITDWTRVDDDTDLGPNDILRVYLRYTIPAGALNSTNPVARYRLPSNLRLTDQQLEEINTTVNGIAGQYINLDTLEILDPDQYNQYLGIEAVEGTRSPADDIDEYFDKHPDMNSQEYISATVSAENVYDTEGLYGDKDAYLGQDLVFTFTPYTVQKNQNEYDADGQPTKAGEKVKGWLCLDLQMDQIEWGEPVVTTEEEQGVEAAENDVNADETAEPASAHKTLIEQKESNADIIFAAEDKALKIDEISTELRMTERTEISSGGDDVDKEQDEDTAVTSESGDETDLAATSADEDLENPAQVSPDGKSEEDGADGTNEAAASTDSALEINAENYPAVSFEDTIVVYAGTLSTDNESASKDTPEETTIAVSVTADSETFPRGTTMVLGAVDDMDTVASAVEGAVEGQTRGFHAVDISFIDPDGNEIEPLKPIKVSMTSEAIKQAVEDASTVPVVVHVENPADSALANASAPADPTAAETASNGSVEADAAPQKAALTADKEDPASAPTATIVESNETTSTDNSTDKKGTADTLSFDAGSFSVYAIVYTVDFHYEVNGKMYEFSIPGGGFVSLEHVVEMLSISEFGTQSDSGDEIAAGNAVHNAVEEAGVEDTGTYSDAISLNTVEVSEATRMFVSEVESVKFSSPELVWVGKAEESTTVGELKKANGLDVQYSVELTEEQIAEINGSTVEAGDWALISVQPFTSEEVLTVTMKNGEQFTVKVTDDRVTSLAGIDENKGYILYTLKNGNYYVLKTDGGTVTTTRASDLDTMGNEYKWNIKYVYTDYSTGISYYMIKPCDDNSRSIDLGWDTTFPWNNPNNRPLVANDNCNVIFTPSGNGFKIEGYNNTKLILEDGWFAGRRGSDFSEIVIYDQAQLSQYKYTVLSDDYGMGKVCGTNDQNQYKEDAEFDAFTNNNKYNANEIKAVPQTSRYIFDYWDLNGERLNLGATIPAGTLAIPYQGSRLTAHFKKDPNYQASDEEKEGRVIDKESFRKWLKELRERNIPLNQDGCTKTAELYDYENRIYRVDLTAQSNLSMFNGDIDLGFIIDVSGSMQFPSKLEPVAGKESIDVGNINSNYYTQHQLDTNKVYYIIVDRTNTANVLRLKWCDGPNPAYPNHTGWPTGNPNSSSTSWHTGWGISGLGYEEDALDSATRYFTDTSGALFGGDNGPFQIYTAGDNGKRRREYLESSIAGTISELRSILGDLAYAQNSSEAADVKIAYNTFANDVDYNHTNHNFVSVTSGLSIGYDYKGGTDTEEALNDARDFFWNDSATKVAVLITDGAPQQSGLDGPTIDARVKTAADALKNEEGVKLITVGLSMGDVKRGSRLLYDIATKDSDGDPYFYKADTGDELQYALYEVIQQVMADAIVVGNVTDTVNEAFYPVDKETGAPLVAGNVIDLTGIKIANSISGLTEEQKAAGYGVIGQDNDGNYTITWNGQNFTWDGWHGTVYEKAKEDFLGGNAVRTNNPEKPATIVSEGYKIRPQDPTIAFKPEITAQGTKSLETPRVNVNELDLTDANTEWTVYLGTKVDPKSQLEAFYDNILVKEVVTDAADTDEDGFPDRMNGTSLYYPLLESISDGRESTAAGEQVTFKMKDLLKKLNNGTDITIDDIIAAGEDGITIPYDLYGQDCPGTIKIKLIKTGATANYDSHTTTVTGDAVETYKLLVDFAPDYVHLPEGQGGDGSKPYHRGSYSLAYEGNAAGEDYSTNTHIINVYNVPLDVYKTDENDGPLSGAVFKLYKAGGSGTISGLSGNYTEVASGTSGSDGVAHLTFAAGMETGLVPGATYYLVEDEAPENYTKVNTVWTVQVQTEIGKFTDLNNEQIYAADFPTLDASMYPFNWDQGARIVVDGQPVKVVTKGETENTTTTITDGSYVSHKDAISFRHTVQNLKADTSINVKKTWNDDNDLNRPASVTVKLYRVSEKGHQWYNGTIVPCTCTKDGVKEYTCSVCGEKDTHVIDKAGHKQGDAHQENYHAPTCTEPGSFDTVVRCTVCNAIISSTHETIPATGHTWVNQETETSDPENYCYDIADVCSVCGTVKEETRVHHAHDWGAWEVTTPAQPGVPGEETRICKHDPSHIDHQDIPALSTDHTVTIYFRCTGDGNGNTYYPGHVTSIATRSGTGSGDMTIKWNWDQRTSPQRFTVDGLGSSTYTTSSSGNYYGAEQTLTISNITSDLTLYVTIRNYGYMGTNDGLIGQPTFSGNRNHSSRSLNAVFASPLERRSSNGESLALKSEGTSTTPKVLEGISGLKTKTEASCSDIYWEEVSDTYQITATDNWTLSIPDLPKYNEYGKEYTYYVEEVPVIGYDTTYSEQGTTKPEIINTPKVVDLTVTKEWVFANPSTVTKVEGKEWPQGVTVHVVVYSKTGENDPAPTSHAVDLTANQPTYTFTGLPEYSGGNKIEYSVVEAGITGLDSEHFNTVIEGNAESGYTIKNTEKEAGLTIIKAFEGAELTEAQKNVITFTVTGTGLKDRSTGNSVESLTKTYAEFTEGQWVLNQSDGIVNGRTYTVTETNSNVEHYNRVTTVKVNDGEATSSAQGSADPSGSITMSSYQGTITITNTYTKLANLKIIKVDSNGMETLLEGALFELRKVDPENTTLSYLDEAATLPTTTGEDHKTGTDGEAVFADLAQGYYEVKETEMPAGYVRTGDGVFYIKVENGTISHVVRTITEDEHGENHVTWTSGTDEAKFTFTAESERTPAIAKVGNEPGAALPDAGGPGTTRLYLLGLLLTAIAGAGLMMKNRRKNKA